MTGFYRRALLVVWRFLPFAVAFARDRRRFLLFGPRRRLEESVHRERARRMRDRMMELGPAFVKVGQVLSTRPDVVPPVYAETFGTLQDEIPEGMGGEPVDVLREELGEHLDVESREPVAGGSLAFVYTVAYDGERIAVKVRRPGVREQVARDLRVLDALVPLLAPFVPARQRYSLVNAVDDFEDVILDELDFERERELMAEIRRNLADDGDVVVPQVHDDLSTERALAMEYVEGTKITADGAFDGHDVSRHEMAERIAETYLTMGLVDGVFHADPHPGNLAVTDDGRLVLYDFGMSERLAPSDREDIVRLYRALVRRDVDELVDALVVLDVLERGVNRTEVGRVLELVIENLEGKRSVTWRDIIQELTAMLRAFPFRIPPDVMLLVRVGTVGEGVCRQLDPEFDFLAIIRRVLVEEGLIETELEALVRESATDLSRSLPALARAPARLERTLDRLDRGDVVVGTTDVDGTRRGDPHLGYAVVASGLAVAAAVLATGDAGYVLPTAALAGGFLAVYLFAHHAS
jgi:predicted unusual protein kinase regulating ubiquinone biosynthesis (AarF/ABC1/UbiB family)